MPELSVNGTTLFYRLDGPERGPWLVLLNGIFQRTEAWEPLMPYLQGFRVLRYDMRGQGQSAVPPGPYPPGLHADDLAALLEALGITRYHLLGLSNGGVVAQVHGARQPAGLEKLILLCTTPRLDPLLRAKVESWRQALAWGAPAGACRLPCPGSGAGPSWRPIRRSPARPRWCRWSKWPPPPRPRNTYWTAFWRWKTCAPA
ncbi:alpha/beta fold hydrolase [Meiothermus taiwanensis]|uniref:alpha/beta fold hydrolase n=1 Tax=Meiothermus taiwanensis TaxID=172827 RepID=UPI000AF14178|nr:alpha/beta hydrolase [Meiothermus taiwanensis]